MMAARKPPAPPPVRVGNVDDPGGLFASTAWKAIATAGVAAGAFHGYRQHGSVLAAFGWALLGGVFPVVVIPVAVASEVGKRV